MRRKLRTKRGRECYALRMATVEPVFGQIKAGRGFRQFLLRGLDQVNGEWSLISTGHNLLQLFRFGAKPTSKPPGKGIIGSIHNPAGGVNNAMCEKPMEPRHRAPASIIVAISSLRTRKAS